MLITLPNADFSGAGLGTVERLLYGIPQTSLLGLYLFDEGADGSEITSVTDVSGNGNHATLMQNWSAGIKRSYGMEAPQTANGTAYETAIPLNPSSRKLTIFAAAMNTLPGNQSGVYVNWIGSANSPGMDDPDAPHPNTGPLTLNYRGTLDPGVWQVYDNGDDLLGTSTISRSGGPTYNQAGIAGIEIDGTAGIASLHQLGVAKTSNNNAAIAAYYDGITDRGKMAFGPTGHGGTRSPTYPLGRNYMVAAYNRTFSDAEGQKVMGFMRQVLEARGITFP